MTSESTWWFSLDIDVAEAVNKTHVFGGCPFALFKVEAAKWFSDTDFSCMLLEVSLLAVGKNDKPQV